MIPLELLAKAARDVEQAAHWYEQQATGLGRLFAMELNRQFNRIRQFPESYPQISSAVRRSNLQRFPFTIVYRVLSDRIQVIAVFACRSDPDELSSRTLD